MFARSATLTYKSHVILISLTVGTPRSIASADDFRELCPAVRCYQILVKQRGIRLKNYKDSEFLCH